MTKYAVIHEDKVTHHDTLQDALNESDEAFIEIDCDKHGWSDLAAYSPTALHGECGTCCSWWLD